MPSALSAPWKSFALALLLSTGGAPSSKEIALLNEKIEEDATVDQVRELGHFIDKNQVL